MLTFARTLGTAPPPSGGGGASGMGSGSGSGAVVEVGDGGVGCADASVCMSICSMEIQPGISLLVFWM